MSSNSPIIRFKDVYKYYYAGDEKVTALSGISLEFQQGDFVSIVNDCAIFSRTSCRPALGMYR